MKTTINEHFDLRRFWFLCRLPLVQSGYKVLYIQVSGFVFLTIFHIAFLSLDGFYGSKDSFLLGSSFWMLATFCSVMPGIMILAKNLKPKTRTIQLTLPASHLEKTIQTLGVPLIIMFLFLGSYLMILMPVVKHSYEIIRSTNPDHFRTLAEMKFPTAEYFMVPVQGSFSEQVLFTLSLLFALQGLSTLLGLAVFSSNKYRKRILIGVGISYYIFLIAINALLSPRPKFKKYKFLNSDYYLTFNAFEGIIATGILTIASVLIFHHFSSKREVQ